jgi:hypothetical protein
MRIWPVVGLDDAGFVGDLIKDVSGMSRCRYYCDVCGSTYGWLMYI